MLQARTQSALRQHHFPTRRCHPLGWPWQYAPPPLRLCVAGLETDSYRHLLSVLTLRHLLSAWTLIRFIVSYGFPPFFEATHHFYAIVHINSKSLCVPTPSFHFPCCIRVNRLVHHIPCFSCSLPCQVPSRRWSAFCIPCSGASANGKGFVLAVHVAEDLKMGVVAFFY